MTQPVRPHPGLHLRRDLAGHAPPRRGRRPQRAVQRDGAALHRYALSEDRWPSGPDRRPPHRRQRRAGEARADKTIGKSLEAEVDLTVPAEDAFLAEMDAALWPTC